MLSRFDRIPERDGQTDGQTIAVPTSRVSVLTRDSNSVDRLAVRSSVRHVPVFYRNDSTYCHSFFTTR